MSYVSPALTLLISAVKKAGQSLTRDFNEVEQLQSSVRGATDFAKSAVSRADRTLRQELSRARPSFAFAEEGKPEPQGPHFVVSSVDGFANFAHGVPYFAMTVTVVENSVPLMAVIYNPATDELFFSEKGCGAFKEGFRNHERLRVSSRKDIMQALVATEKGGEALEEYQQLYVNLLHNVDSVRVNGALSLDMAYVAAGKLDAVASIQQSTAQMMAGILLVKEAGGLIRDIHAQDMRGENLSEVLSSGDIMATNAAISAALYNILNK